MSWVHPVINFSGFVKFMYSFIVSFIGHFYVSELLYLAEKCSERLKQLAGSSFKGIEEKVRVVSFSLNLKLTAERNIFKGGDLEQAVVPTPLSEQGSERRRGGVLGGEGQDGQQLGGGQDRRGEQGAAGHGQR